MKIASDREKNLRNLPLASNGLEGDFIAAKEPEI